MAKRLSWTEQQAVWSKKRASIMDMHRRNYRLSEIARHFNISKARVHQIIRKEEGRK